MHVLLIEDDPLVASGIRSGLMMYDFVVDHVSTIQAAGQIMQSVVSDVVILDRGLPDGDGLQLLQSWRDQGNATPVLMLTARDAVRDRVDGLQCGADDYLVKPFDLDELVARLHALLRRVSGRSQGMTVHGALTLDPHAREVRVSGQLVTLSRRELVLLEAFLHSPRSVLSADQLKDSLYGLSDDVESNALNVHIHHLRRKLGSGIIETVRGLGYRLGKPEAVHIPGTPHKGQQ
ncbi:response regulator transcription factor [Halomonas sp. XH26]|uniref:DNA-binding response regulator n=1 Tax=Vreelandella alkaliphila TaxID=272774 RepID=A0AAJ2RYQ6_9GAMM|nr:MULTISPECIES: response regulator transcription factor [Halomonas]AIA76815.1 transcriptional regulator [Halomonas campaniensis]AYF34526.1 DNA-binding response regulator [Halomonas alkaliphila]MCD6006563.1 response regulator transcription factor [Halomonas sp. IOP_6]MCD6436998.1 response regulator transcription factor [Halomonas sp.]MDX5976756.1 response regulator transcription factor [Halomonas alkaliphila]